jgi:hypothetical protein
LEERADKKAGTWPPKALALAGRIAGRCLEHNARSRATIRELLPQLQALAKIKK